ncbi:hypothetical protein Slin15195_G062210 [Septoria linicola]|uniref:Uncharacterized protein n=1 Tax=Septoria linicola TaxID=215465 RepID=A0A9Q9AVV5_9PEZI|nr:hypothetical protein Slin14017_G078020 [Septoria linicola]USW52902.1 hypothetical protein Slin15195_G062210 [Septoria linicola]
MADIRTPSTTVSASTARLNSLQLSAPPRPPMINFPLPQELRDEIYGYLLDADAVKTSSNTHESFNADVRRISDPEIRSYHFQCQISRLNKTIKQDARRYLLSHNSFVRIDYDLPCLKYWSLVLDVPMVTAHGLSSFEHLSYVVDFSWCSDPPPKIARSSARPARSRPDASLLVLERDLPRFWTVLQLLCSGRQTKDSLEIRSLASEKLVMETCGSRTAMSVMKIVAVDDAMSRRTREQKRQFLSALSQVVGGGYHLTLHGFREKAAKSCSKKIAPSLVWPRAKYWERLQVVLSLKQEIENLLARGDYGGAGQRYGLLQGFPLHDRDRLSWQECYDARTAGEMAPLMRLTVLQHDIAMSAAIAWL